MRKAELVEAVASGAGVDKRQAEQVLNAFFDTVKQEAGRGEKVAWPGFGSFSTSQRGPRSGRNPRTGDAVEIPGTTSMRFSQSAGLKSYLNAAGPAPAGDEATAKKATAKKATAKKATAKKAPAKKAPAGKAPAKKATARRGEKNQG